MVPPQRMWIDNVLKKKREKKALSSIFKIYFIIITICFATRHRENVVSSSASLTPIQGSSEGVSSQIYRGEKEGVGIHAVRLFAAGELFKNERRIAGGGAGAEAQRRRGVEGERQRGD